MLENGKEVRLQKKKLALEGCFVTDREEVESIEFQTKEDDDGSHVESGEIEEMDGKDGEGKKERKKKKNRDPMEEDGNKQGLEETKKEKKEEKRGRRRWRGEEEDEEGEEGEKGGMKARLRRPTRTPENGPPSQQAAAAIKQIVDKESSRKPGITNANFNRLTGPTLLKYRNFTKCGADTDDVVKENKMVDEVTRHFMSQKAEEQKCLAQLNSQRRAQRR